MGLFDQKLSMNQVQAMERKRIQEIGLNLLSSIKGSLTQMYNGLWCNPQGLTPQQMMDAFGTDASLFWSTFKALTDQAQAIDSTFSLINSGTVTSNKDGTATATGLSNPVSLTEDVV